MLEYSVSAVRKSIEALARKYEKNGFNTKVDWFHSGKGGEWANSYVTLEVEKECSNGERFWYEGRFICNGYSAFGKDEYSTHRGLKEAKKLFNEAVEKDLKYYI